MASKDELKTLLLDYLRKSPKTQFESVLQQGFQPRLGRVPNAQEIQIVLELIHELIASNVLMPGIDRGNATWPWLSVTAHGSSVLATQGPPVYDYSGYLSELRSRVSNLDDIVAQYLSESLRAYQYNLYFASAVMLACASERAVLMLMEAYVASIGDETNRAKLAGRLASRDISTAYARFKESFDSTKGQLGVAMAVRDFDLHVDATFTFVRIVRNSVVHAKELPQLTSSVVYANLQQFSYYVETIFVLIQHYKTNNTTV